MREHLRWAAASIAVFLVGCSSAPPPAPATAPAPASAPATVSTSTNLEADAFRALVAAPDRTDADRALDGGRHPAELLAFFHIKPGMKIAELGAGGGYTSELLARAVGPTGVVYAQNNKAMLEKFANKALGERLARAPVKNIVRLDREFDDPLPPEAHDLDAVFDVLFYHDTVWLNVDRDKMNAAVFKALKKGGVYAIVDHSGRTGTGETETKTLHRIEESALKAEIEKAGFKLQAQGDFLRNAADTRDWNDSPSAAGDKRGTSDRFVLAFVKP